MMFTQGMKDQENSVDMAKAQAQEMNENRPKLGGITESSPNITSKTIESNGINKDELDKITQQNNAPIKDAAIPAHENTPSL